MNHGPNFVDLTGRKFGRLTVVSYCEYRKGVSKWKCTCVCGNVKITRASSLIRGVCTSCGCLVKENLSRMRKKKWSPVIIDDVCRIPLGNSNKVAVIDKEDLPKVISKGWHLNNRGYAATDRNNRMHCIIKGKPPVNMVTDHINRDKLYNRKTNLRFATFTDNAQNSGIRSSNSSGVKFISYSKRRHGYQYLVRVVDPVTKTRHYLGFHNTKDEAIKALDLYFSNVGAL